MEIPFLILAIFQGLLILGAFPLILYLYFRSLRQQAQIDKLDEVLAEIMETAGIDKELPDEIKQLPARSA